MVCGEVTHLLSQGYGRENIVKFSQAFGLGSPAPSLTHTPATASYTFAFLSCPAQEQRPFHCPHSHYGSLCGAHGAVTSPGPAEPMQSVVGRRPTLPAYSGRTIPLYKTSTQTGEAACQGHTPGAARGRVRDSHLCVGLPIAAHGPSSSLW